MVLQRVGPHNNDMNALQLFLTCKRTNNANNATHYVKLSKKRRESSKSNYYIFFQRVVIKAAITILPGSKQV